MNRSLVSDLLTAAFINKREDAVVSRSAATGKKSLWRRPSASAPSSKANKVLYRETHILLDELADAVVYRRHARKEYMESVKLCRC